MTDTAAKPEPSPVPILLIVDGEPVAVLGHAVKQRKGALLRACRDNAAILEKYAPGIVERNPTPEYARGALAAERIVVCFAGREPVCPPARDSAEPSVERVRRHRRRQRLGLVTREVEVPALRAAELDALLATWIAEEEARAERPSAA